MTIPIANLVPVEVTMAATDLASGKLISNILYYQNEVQTTAPPAYGAALAGPTSLATFVGNVYTAWKTYIMALLNTNYKMRYVRARPIIGSRYKSTLLNIVAITPGAVPIVTVSSPTIMTSGQTVIVAGATGVAGANGTWTITRITATQFVLDGTAVTGAYTGGGTLQLVSGPLQFNYGPQVVTLESDAGTVTGSALPLFATLSARRINPGVGRNWRSRISLSPMSVSQQLDGGWTSTAKTAFATNLSSFEASSNANGGTDATSQYMIMGVVSHALALLLPSPFTSAAAWFNLTSTMTAQPDQGSLTRRKPKLTSAIV